MPSGELRLSGDAVAWGAALRGLTIAALLLEGH
jgi:hypothetical protein